jgi:hypothetical protein
MLVANDKPKMSVSFCMYHRMQRAAFVNETITPLVFFNANSLDIVCFLWCFDLVGLIVG